MLMIRLARRGKKNQSFFRLVVSDKRKDLFGPAKEIVGHYNPVSKNREIKLDAERITYWLSKGAQVSPTVRNLLVDAHIMTGAKSVVKKEKKKKEKK